MKNCNKCNVSMEDQVAVCPNCGANQGEAADSCFSPTIEIERESCIVGFMVKYKVFIDGKEVGTLKNGEKKRFQRQPGLHEIQLKQNLSWLGSPKVSFMLKDFKKFSCKPKVGIIGSLFGRVFYYIFISPKKFIVLKEV